MQFLSKQLVHSAISASITRVPFVDFFVEFGKTTYAFA